MVPTPQEWPHLASGTEVCGLSQGHMSLDGAGEGGSTVLSHEPPRKLNGSRQRHEVFLFCHPIPWRGQVTANFWGQLSSQGEGDQLPPETAPTWVQIGQSAAQDSGASL